MPASGQNLHLTVCIDVICPWCYVGKRRMEKALASLGNLGPMGVSWFPFQLNPDVPKEGIERRAYRLRKFGSWERSQQLDAQLRDVGAHDGIAFRHDLMTRTPNTLNAHRLIWFARPNNVDENLIVEALFRAYFTEGRDIGDALVLAELASGAGLDGAKTREFLNTEEGSHEVLQQEDAARRAGVSGVPAFFVNGRPLLIGAHPPEVIASALHQTAGDLAHAPAH